MAALVLAAVATLHLASASGDVIDVDRTPDVSGEAAAAQAQRMADFIRRDYCRQTACRELLHISIWLGRNYCLADVAQRAWYRCRIDGQPFRDDSDVVDIGPARPPN